MSVLALVLIVAGCTGAPPSQSQELKGPITIGSKIDTEGALLSQSMILMLRSNGFEVVDRSQFGATQVVRKALLSGELDV